MESVKILPHNALQPRGNSSTSWFQCGPHYYSLHFTGHGDQRDVSSKNSEGSGGWSHSRDEGTGGHHWMHQAGADGMSAWQVQTTSSGVCWESTDETQPLGRAGSKRVRDIYVYYSEQNRGAFCSFFSPLFCLSSSFPHLSLSAPAGFSQLLFLIYSLSLSEDHSTWEEALPRAAAKTKWITVLPNS